MSELRITRSRDIELYIDGEQLFGVTDFHAKTVSEGYPIREYLSDEPVAIVSGRKEIEIRMSVLSLFHFAVTQEDGFILRAVDGDTVYCYDGCTVVGSERSVKTGRYVVDEFVIQAAKMRKQVLKNGG